jgi:putative ABC transport system permease protein
MSLWKSATLWKYSLREMRHRPGRTLLTLAGIVIGVAAIVGIAAAVQTTRLAFREMFETVTGRASLEVVAEGMGGFDPALPERLERVAGVKAAVPVIQAPAGLIGAAGPVPVLALGVDPHRDQAAREYVLQAGHELDGGEELWLETGFARTQGRQLGDSVRLLTPSGVAKLPVAGLLEPHGAAAFNGGAIVFMPLPVAQRLFGLRQQINSVHLVLHEGANLREVEAEVRRQLPPGLTVQTPAARGQLAQATLLSTEQGLTSLSAVSLVAGALVILNTFLMNLGERRRQLAIWRALGATRRQVTGFLLGEAAFLGIVGTLIGIPAGLGLASVVMRLMEQLMVAVLGGLRLTALPFVLAFLLGPGMALAATYVPIRRAGRRPPLDELLARPLTESEGSHRWPGYLGLTLVLATLSLEMAVVFDWFPPALGQVLLPPSLAVCTIGFVLLIPLVVRPLIRLVAAGLKPLLGVESVLACRQLGRNRNRTSLTVGVVFVAVLVAMGLGNSLLNNVRSVHVWYERTIVADFLLRGTMPDTGSMAAAALPEAYANQLRALEGVQRVEKVNFILSSAQGRRVVVLARSMETGAPLGLDLVEGDAEEVRRGLWRGEVVLGTVLAQQLGLHRGDTLTVPTRRGPQTLRIAGTATEYTVGGMTLTLEWNVAKPLFESAGVHCFLVTARKGAAPAVEKALKAFGADHELLFQSNEELLRQLEQMMAGIIGFLWVLMALVFLVASLGIVNTLTMNVLEQTRELGILRALGTRRGQIQKMIFSQAVAIAVISLLPGAGLGMGLAYLVNLATYPLTGQQVAFQFQMAFVAECVLVGLATAVLAALGPARRAARLPVVMALHYE